MPISFQCACGTKLKAEDGESGSKVRCPMCKKVLTVPAKKQGNEIVAEVQKKEVPTAELVEDHEFDVLEDEHSLPTVERVKKPKKKAAAPKGPRIKSLDAELFERRPSFFGWDVGSSAHSMVYWVVMLFGGCFLLCLACGLILKIFDLLSSSLKP